MLPGSFTELLCEFLELKQASDLVSPEYFAIRADRFFDCDKIFNKRLFELEGEINKRVDGL